MLLQKKGGKVEEIAPATGTPLGMLPHTHYQQVEKELEPGDRVVLISGQGDGNQSMNDELFGEKRLIKFLEKEKANWLCCYSNWKKLNEFSTDAPQFDDKTTVSFQLMR